MVRSSILQKVFKLFPDGYLLIYVDPAAYEGMANADEHALMQEYLTLSAEMRQAGVNEGGDPLQPVNTATTVRVRNGRTLTTDGPFAETKEHLLGFFLLNCKNLDDALAYAAKIPDARHGSVEVRPIMELAAPQ
jgi:hypothetical protein